MGYYKFNPKNHICSLAWTGIVLLSQLDTNNSLIEKVFTPIIMGVPTVFVGINLREKAEIKLRKKVVDCVDSNIQMTAGQVANLLNIPGREARILLDSLVKEERIEITNRSSDMAVVYIPVN